MDISKNQEQVISECLMFWALTINMPTAGERIRELSYTAPKI